MSPLFVLSVPIIIITAVYIYQHYEHHDISTEQESVYSILTEKTTQTDPIHIFESTEWKHL